MSKVNKRCSGDFLATWSTNNRVIHAELARGLDIDYSQLWRILTSRVRPSWPLMLRIRTYTDGAITPNDFAYPTMYEMGEFDEKEKLKAS